MAVRIPVITKASGSNTNVSVNNTSSGVRIPVVTKAPEKKVTQGAPTKNGIVYFGDNLTQSQKAANAAVMKKSIAEGNKKSTQSVAAIKGTDVTVANEAKRKILAGKNLSSTEMSVVKKYGIASVFGNDTKAINDLLAKDNPVNIARFEAVKKADELKQAGMPVQENDKNTLELATLINRFSKEYWNDKFTLESNPNVNAQKFEDIKAHDYYNTAAYDRGTINYGDFKLENKTDVEPPEYLKNINTGVNRVGLYAKTGADQFKSGVMTFADVITGVSPEEIAERPDSAYSTASSMLRQHYQENGEKLNVMMQDVITNMVNNAPAMAVGMMTAGFGSLISGALSTAAFAPSVFGNAYNEALDLGIRDQGKLLLYSSATTASECLLQYALSGIPKVGGVLSGDIIKNISKNFSSVIGKATTKIIGNAASEAIEEGTQSLLGPILQKYILGVDVETVFDNPLAALSQAAYEGLIGALSATFMGGFGDVMSAKSDVAVTKLGESYSNVLAKTNTDIKNVATLYKEISKKSSNLNKTATKVLNSINKKGTTSNFDIGQMIVEANTYSKESASVINRTVGENIKSTEGGLSKVVDCYNELVEQKAATFDERITKLAAVCEQAVAENAELTAETVGEFAIAVQTFAPRAIIVGQTAQQLEQSTTDNALEQSAESNYNSNDISADNIPAEDLGDDEFTASPAASVPKNGQTISGTAAPILQSTAENTPASGSVEQDNNAEGGSHPVLREPDSKEIYRKPDSEQYAAMLSGKERTIPQRQVEDVAKKLGLKVRWSSEVSRGKINLKTKTITINPSVGLITSYATIFGHEFTHYLELKKAYTGFKKYLFERSKAFEDYIKGRYEKVTGEKFEGFRSELLNAYTDIVFEQYKNSTELSKYQRDSFTRENAEQEMVADFVGDKFFANDNIEDTAAALEEIAKADKTWLQRFRDFLKGIISKISGERQNKTLEEDLNYLYKRLLKVYESETKNIITSGVIKLSQKSENTLAENVAKIMSMSDEESLKLKDEDLYITVSKHTPSIILEKVSGAKDIETLIRFDAVYLAARHSGVLDGNYHNFGENFADKLIKVLTEPDAIIRLNEKRINLFGRVSNAKGKNSLVSIELNTVKNIDDHYDKYNLVVTMMPLYDNFKYVKNLTKGAQSVEYQREDLLQVNPQLHTSLSIINNKSSIGSISNPTENVKGNNDKNSIRPNSPITSPQKYVKRLLRNNRSNAQSSVVEEKINEAVKAVNRSDYAEAISLTTDAAYEVMSNSRNLEMASDDAMEIVKAISDVAVTLSDNQKAETTYHFGSYGEFKNRNMGRIKIRNEGVPLDVQWQEWAAEYPTVFDKDISDVDMPVALANIIEGLKTTYDYDINAAVGSLSSQIFTEVISGFQNQLTDEMQTAIKEAQRLHKAEIAKYKREIKQKDKRLARQREQLKRDRAELSAEITAQREERSTKQKNIEFIRREVKRIDKRLRTNSDNKNVPEHLKEAIGHFIKVFVDNDRSPFDKRDISYISSVYSRLEGDYNEGGETLMRSYDFDIKRNLDRLSETIDGKQLRELSVYDTMLVRHIVENFTYMLSCENEIMIANRKYDIDELGREVIDELTLKKAKRTNRLINYKDKGIYASLKPVYFFKQIGGTLEKAYQDIVIGSYKWYRKMENAKTFIREMKEKYHYTDWSDGEFVLETVRGETLELSIEQAMLLYATAKRERTNTQQQAEHLGVGGIVLPESKKGKSLSKVLNELKGDKENKTSETLLNAFTKEVNSRAHKITPFDVNTVSNRLTEEQKHYADALVEYLSTDMAALGNEVSLKLFGIAKYNEDYYIPYNSANNFLFSQPGVTNEQRLKHQSFTNQTVRKANNPLILSDFSDVVADHINRMCMYNALTIPLENMNRILNFQIAGSDSVSPMSVKTEIERTFGKDAISYINQFLGDMNGNVRTSSTDKFIGKMMGKFKKSAVFASASVVIQQPSAIVRAMAYVNPKYFIPATIKTSERDYQQMIEYAPVAGIKEMGRFDTGVGVGNTQWLLQQTPAGLKEKAKAFFDIHDSSFRDDKLSAAAAKADELAWATLWAAVKAETADKTDLKPGTREFFVYSGKRVSEIIELTQVYDSTISRSQIMRDKSSGAQLLTAFMAEPTVTLNMLMDAVNAVENGEKVSKQQSAAIITSLIASVIVNNILKSLVTAGRDDDEEKTYFEKYIGDFVNGTLSDMFIPNLIPFAKDIVSIFKGYDVERSDVSLFSDFKQSIDVLLNKNKAPYEKVESLAGSAAAFFGLPVKNVLRDIRTLHNIIFDFLDGHKTDAAGVKYSVFDALSLGGDLEDIYADLADAAETDNEKEYQRIYKHLIDTGKSDKQINTGLKKAFREEKEIIEQSNKYIAELQNNSTFNSFDDDDKEKLEKKILSTLAQNAKTKATVKDYEAFDVLYTAYRQNKNRYKTLKKQMLADGMTEKQIDDGLELARYSYMKSIGVSPHEYLLYKQASAKKYADADDSGGVSKREKQQALVELDLDSNTKNAIKKIK